MEAHIRPALSVGSTCPSPSSPPTPPPSILFVKEEDLLLEDRACYRVDWTGRGHSLGGIGLASSLLLRSEQHKTLNEPWTWIHPKNAFKDQCQDPACLQGLMSRKGSRESIPSRP